MDPKVLLLLSFGENPAERVITDYFAIIVTTGLDMLLLIS